MKKYEYYQNKFPYEDIIPELDELKVQEIVRDCDYTIEANKISAADFPYEPTVKVNTADAAVFYKMGYDAAKEQIEKYLKAVEINRCDNCHGKGHIRYVNLQKIV
jgi:hypothetical protein